MRMPSDHWLITYHALNRVWPMSRRWALLAGFFFPRRHLPEGRKLVKRFCLCAREAHGRELRGEFADAQFGWSHPAATLNEKEVA